MKIPLQFSYMRLLALNLITVTLCYNYGLPKHLLNRLRLIQNTAAHIVTLSKRFDHITPTLSKLHWLPLKLIIAYILKFYS